MIKYLLIFFISLSTSSFSKDSKFEKKLKKDIKKLSKFNGFIDDNFNLYQDDIISDFKKSITLIYSHGSGGGESNLDHCNKGSANIPQYIRNLHNKKIGDFRVNIYRLCSGVRGLIEPQWDRVHNFEKETGDPNGFIELVDYDGMKIYDKLKQTNKRKIILKKVNELHERGFKNIVLAEHSCGAWQSLALNGKFPEKIKATIGTNPACRGHISDRTKNDRPSWNAYDEYEVNKYFINPSSEINALLFINDKDPYENSETLHFFLNKNKIKIINYTNFKCKNKFGANAHAFPVYPKNDNCFAQWENKNQYIINYLKEVFKS